jgi:hypothetical protein
VRIEIEFFSEGAHESYGLQGIVNRVLLGIVAVIAKAIPQYYAIDAIVEKIGYGIDAFASNHKATMPATGEQDNDRTGVHVLFHAMNFNGGIMDVDDASNATGNAVSHFIYLRLVDSLGIEKGGVGRENRNNNSAGQKRLGLVGLVGRLSCPWNELRFLCEEREGEKE